MNRAETLARQFHDTYERLAPEHGYETRDDTKQFDPTSKNGRLMVATCAAIIDQQVLISIDSLKWWRELVDLNPADLAPRLDALIREAAETTIPQAKVSGSQP